MTRRSVRRRVGTADAAMLLALPVGLAALLALPMWPAGWWLWAAVGGLMLLALAAARGERVSRVSAISPISPHPGTPAGQNRRSQRHGGV